MKGTKQFKKVIEAHLQEMAAVDTQFAVKLQNEKKNIDGCINYILNTVKNSGCNGFADEEIFGMAVHYYDEENVDAGKPVNANVVINHHVEKEKIQSATVPITQAKKPAKEVKKASYVPYVQPSLFD